MKILSWTGLLGLNLNSFSTISAEFLIKKTFSVRKIWFSAELLSKSNVNLDLSLLFNWISRWKTLILLESCHFTRLLSRKTFILNQNSFSAELLNENKTLVWKEFCFYFSSWEKFGYQLNSWVTETLNLIRLCFSTAVVEQITLMFDWFL